MAHNLLAFLWDRHTLYPFYQEHPEAALEFIRKIQVRLRDELERLPNGSKAFWLIREMHEACLGFSIRIDPLTRTGPCEETKLLSDKRADGAYQRVLEDALIGLRETVNSRMDEL